MSASGARRANTQTAAASAADEYVSACRLLFANAATDAAVNIDAAAADTALATAFDAWAPDSAAPIIAAAHRLFDAWTEYAEGAHDGRPGRAINEATARRFQAQLASVTATADNVLSDNTFDQQEELDGATADLATAETELMQARAALEAAVDRGDLDAVMTLRTGVEVQIPARIAALTTKVLEIEVARAEHRRTHPQRRAEADHARAEKAQAAVMAAHACLAEAQKEAATANMARLNAASILADVDREIAAATTARDEHAARHAQQQRAALRRIAGLPPEPAISTAPAADTTDEPITYRPDVKSILAAKTGADGPHGDTTPRPFPPENRSAWHRTTTKAAS